MSSSSSTHTLIHSADSEQAELTDALPQVKALLGQILRITTKDGRIFIGTLAATDKPLNIILINTEEYRTSGAQATAAAAAATANGRHVGQVIVPWKVVDKVEAQTTTPRQDVRERHIHDDWYIW